MTGQEVGLIFLRLSHRASSMMEAWERRAQAASRLAAGHRRRRREAALTVRARR
jgi:hypothetical protein